METNSPATFSAPIKHNERHHTNEAYALPSDKEEAGRLQLQHNLLRAAFEDRIVLAPVQLTADAEVLDIGTGTGAWALDFVATYPNADQSSVLCIDIGTRLFPQNPPPNIAFRLGNILEQDALEWENRFALVHQRLLMFALTYDQWEGVIRKIYTITAPGGWAQLLEGNFLSHCSGCGPVTVRATEILKAQAKASGLDPFCSLRLEELMKKVGFVDVQTILREIPLGLSHGEMGAKFAENIMSAFRGLKSLTLRSGGFGLVRDEQDYDNLMDEMELEWNEPGSKIGWYVAVGRKV